MKPARGSGRRPLAWTLRLYRALARAFPHEFKIVYEEDLVQTAEDAAGTVWRRHGALGLLRLLSDLAIRLPAEYLSELWHDVRYALRMLAASPGFTAAALVSLSLGIGIATCAYSEMNGLLRDLPSVPHPEELVALQGPVSYPAYERYRELTDLFSSTFAYLAPVPFGVSFGRENVRTWGHLVTPSYFSTLGVRPFLGRFFEAADEQPGRAPGVVVSHRFWKERLDSDSAVIGKPLRVNGQPCTVLGVGSQEFLGASPTLFPADLWLPVSADVRLAPELAGRALERRDLPMFQMAGRLRPGVLEAAAQARLSVVAQQWAESFGEPGAERPGAGRKDRRVQLVSAGKILPLRKQDVPFFKEFFLLLGGLLLLIACANVANMMLARAAARRREIAVRLALGASRARLVRQLLTESVLLALGAALPAILLSYWLMHLVSQLRLPLPIPVSFDLRPDWRALVFTFLAASLTGIAFGLAPAWQSTRAALVSTLKESTAEPAGGRRRFSLRNGLMISQFAASLTLLLVTGYLGLGIQSTLGVQEGFNPRHLYLISLDPVRDGYPAASAANLLERLLDRVKALPAVSSACLTDTLPAALDGNAGVRFSEMGARSGAAPKSDWARKHIVGYGYFETAGIAILAGRGFRKQDEGGDRAAVVVSRELVRRFWNGEDAVGRRLEIANGEPQVGVMAWPGSIDLRSGMLGNERRTFEVIGVAGDVSEDLVASKKHPAIYFPLSPAAHAQPSLRGVTLLVRAAPGVDMISAVRREIAALDPAIVPFHTRSMTEHIAQFMATLEAASWTYGLMGFFGLALASVGLAGVTAYSAARRNREIGIRIALGARRHHILALVMKEGAVLIVIGTVVGLAFAWAGIRALSSAFFTVASVKSSDPVLLAGAPALLAALALLACFLPARRSTRIDPAVTLRME